MSTEKSTENKLHKEKDRIVEEIEKAQKNIVKLRREITKEESSILKKEKELRNVECKLKNYCTLSKEAFVFCMKSCNNDLNKFMQKFNFNKDQMIRYYSENKILYTLHFLIDHMILNSSSTDDVRSLLNLSLTNSDLLGYVLRKNKNRKEYVYLLGVQKILSRIRKYKEILEDPQTFNPFNRQLLKTPTHYIERYLLWKDLLQYFDQDSIPKWVDEIPPKIKSLVEQKRAFMNMMKENVEADERQAEKAREDHETGEKFMEDYGNTEEDVIMMQPQGGGGGGGGLINNNITVVLPEVDVRDGVILIDNDQIDLQLEGFVEDDENENENVNRSENEGEDNDEDSDSLTDGSLSFGIDLDEREFDASNNVAEEIPNEKTQDELILEIIQEQNESESESADWGESPEKDLRDYLKIKCL